MKLIAARCPNCGADIEVDKNSDTTKCEYCNKKIIVDDAVAKYKLELSGSVEVSNSTNFTKLLKLAERFLSEKQYDQALEKYNKAIELEPDDTFVDYRISYIKFLKNVKNVDSLNYAYKKLLSLDHSLDENFKKQDDTFPLYEEFFNSLYNITKNTYNIAKDTKRNDLDLIKGSINMMYKYISYFELCYAIPDIPVSLKEHLLVYILDTIYYLSSVYEYIYGQKHYYQDTEHINILKDNKEKYYNELIALNPSYKDVLNYKIKKINLFIYNHFFGSPTGFVTGVINLILLIIAALMFISFVFYMIAN